MGSRILALFVVTARHDAVKTIIAHGVAGRVKKAGIFNNAIMKSMLELIVITQQWLV